MPFTGLAVIPGAKPGQNVSIRPQLLRVDKLVTGGRQVRLRAILSAFVKVTETCELNVAEDVTGPLVLAKRVVAAGNRQVLVESITDLTVPAQKVHEIQARVCEISCEVIPNKVIVQGLIHKQVFFVGPDDVVHHQAEDIPFTTFVDVPGALPSMNCQLRGEVEHISWQLLDAAADGDGDFRLGETRDDLVTFCRLAQKTVIELTVIVAEDQQIHVRILPLTVVPPTQALPTQAKC